MTRQADSTLHEYARMFYKRLTAYYHGYSSLYSRVVAVSDVPGEAAGMVGEAATFTHATVKTVLHVIPATLILEKMLLYGEWRHMKGKANQVTDFFAGIGITPIQVITELTLGFTMAFMAEIRKAAAYTKRVWDKVVDGAAWAILGSDVDTAVKELARDHCRWIIKTGVAEVPVYEGIGTLERFLKHYRKELPLEMRGRSLVPPGFQQSMIVMMSDVREIKATTTATQGELREMRTEVRSSTVIMYERFDENRATSERMESKIDQLLDQRQKMIDKLENEKTELKNKIMMLTNSCNDKDAIIAQLEEEKEEHQRRQQAQSSTEANEEDTQPEGPSCR